MKFRGRGSPWCGGGGGAGQWCRGGDAGQWCRVEEGGAGGWTLSRTARPAPCPFLFIFCRQSSTFSCTHALAHKARDGRPPAPPLAPAAPMEGAAAPRPPRAVPTLPPTMAPSAVKCQRIIAMYCKLVSKRATTQKQRHTCTHSIPVTAHHQHQHQPPPTNHHPPLSLPLPHAATTGFPRSSIQ